MEFTQISSRKVYWMRKWLTWQDKNFSFKNRSKGKRPIERPLYQVCIKLGHTTVACVQLKDLLTKQHNGGTLTMVVGLNIENGCV